MRRPRKGKPSARDEETPLAITLTGSDVDTDPVTYTLTSSTYSYGELSGVAPDLVYTPRSWTLWVRITSPLRSMMVC